jgi:peroxisomal membrane protein 4
MCSLLGQAQTIFDATLTHSKNLAAFVVTYKTLLVVLREFNGTTQRHHAFIAALIGGYLVFGRYNKINEQVCKLNLSFVIDYYAKID